MFSALLLSLREGLEAALIIGIVLAALKKINRTDLRPWAWGGVLAAALLSLAVSFLLDRLGLSFQGKVEQIFEGLAMLSAAALLTWMILWMQSIAPSPKPSWKHNLALAADGGIRPQFFPHLLPASAKDWNSRFSSLPPDWSAVAMTSPLAPCLGWSGSCYWLDLFFPLPTAPACSVFSR